jgi:uncharacterized protein YfiM (DUF2279 family)
MYSRHISTLLGWLVGAMGMLSLLLTPPVQAQLQTRAACPGMSGSGPPDCAAVSTVRMHEEPNQCALTRSVRLRAVSTCVTDRTAPERISYRAANRALRNDLWFARDKALHLSYSFLWTLSSQYVLTHKTALSHNDSLPWALTSGFTVGLAKELYDDRRPQNAFSWRDMTANAVGIGLAAALIVL